MSDTEQTGVAPAFDQPSKSGSVADPPEPDTATPGTWDEPEPWDVESTWGE